MQIYLNCLFTVIIELLLFVLLGYREKKFLLLVICTNTATNIFLNLLLYHVDYHLFIIPLELLIVLSEYIIYALYLNRSKRLFEYVFLANLITFMIGLLI